MMTLEKEKKKADVSPSRSIGISMAPRHPKPSRKLFGPERLCTNVTVIHSNDAVSLSQSTINAMDQQPNTFDRIASKDCARPPEPQILKTRVNNKINALPENISLVHESLNQWKSEQSDNGNKYSHSNAVDKKRLDSCTSLESNETVTESLSKYTLISEESSDESEEEILEPVKKRKVKRKTRKNVYDKNAYIPPLPPPPRSRKGSNAYRKSIDSIDLIKIHSSAQSLSNSPVRSKDAQAKNTVCSPKSALGPDFSNLDSTLDANVICVSSKPSLSEASNRDSSGSSEELVIPLTPYTPLLATPDLKIEMMDEERRLSMVGLGGPLFPSGFPTFGPEDLTEEEMHNFDMRWGSPHHAKGGKFLTRPTLLALPQHRPRMTSLPNREEDNDDDEDDCYRLRHFSITGRGVVNRGDSFRSRRTRSNASMASDVSRLQSSVSVGPSLSSPVAKMPLILCEEAEMSGVCVNTFNNEAWVWSHPGSLATSAASSAASSRASSASEYVFPFRVVILGGPGVGKTTLCHQFMTSDHINAYDNSLDDEYGEKSVSVMLDGDESEILFVDHPADEMSVENYISTYNPHAFVLVFSVTDRPSFVRAEETLQYLWKLGVMTTKAVILVANKSDLVRNRCVTQKESSSLANSYDCKFIETSSGLNHQVDELLVGILKQIRLKTVKIETSKEYVVKNSHRRKFRGTKTSASLKVKSLLTKVCGKDIKSKSCENLHVL